MKKQKLEVDKQIKSISKIKIVIFDYIDIIKYNKIT